MRIDQYLPSFVAHDAIGNHTLQVRRVLREAGFQSDIHAEAIGAGLGAEAMPFVPTDARPGERILLYHASTDATMAAWLVSRAEAGETVQSYYHNITPSAYFARWLPEAAAGMETARRQLADLAPSVRFAMAASRFSEGELIDLGYGPTSTVPLLVDLADYHVAPDPRRLDRLRRKRAAGGTRWLFVSRLAPNKCQHDVVAAFAVYRKLFDPRAHLTLVGGVTAPRYLTAIRRLAGELDLGDSLELPDTPDTLDFPALLAEFAAADVFVCLSEHEGFGVPLIEAMELGVPVVAFAAAAVPETVGDAGLLLTDKDPLAVAMAVNGLVGDEAARSGAVEAGRARAATFALERTSARLLAAVTAHMEGTAAVP